MAGLSIPWQPDDDAAAVRERAGGATTGGAFALIECYVPPYLAGPPLAVTARATVAFYLLEGMLAVTRGDETLTVTRGECVVVQAATPCRCWNPAGEPARFLLVYAPAGADGQPP